MAQRSKASSNTKNEGMKECYVRLDRTILTSRTKSGNVEDIESSANKNDRSVARKNVSKKLQKKKRAEDDLESSENESDGNVAEKSVSKKRKVLKRSEEDAEFSEDESDTNVAPEKVSQKRAATKRRKENMELSGDEIASENESPENEDSESLSLRITNKHKLLKLNKSRLEEANRKSISCKICKVEFQTYQSFVLHQSMHKTKKFRCTICKETFKHRTSFTNHYKREHPERECYPCEFPGCNASFRTAKESRNHEKYHCKYMCRFCKKRFARKKIMLLHVKETHPFKN